MKTKSQLEELNHMTINNVYVSMWLFSFAVSAFIATAIGLI